MNKILVTGASGFIGQHFLKENKGKYDCLPTFVRINTLSNIDLKNVDCILHLAGIAHQKNITSEEAYADANTKLPISLAKKAIKEGVTQFIYLSSTKVYGDSFSDKVLDIKSPTKPNDAYGKSKLQAEIELSKLNDNKFTVSIVRPPVVYGPAVKGNILKLMEYIYTGRSLPLQDIENRRSMVYIGNLISMLNKIIDTKAAGIFIAGDDKALSTTNLVNYIAAGFDKKSSGFKLPGIFRKLIKLLRPGFYNRIFQSFEIDNSESLKRLNINSQVSTREGILAMTDWYKQSIK